MESVTSELERKRAGLTVDQIAQDGTFSGYASLFGEVDLGRDMVERGAFARSLRRRPASLGDVPFALAGMASNPQ